MGTKKGKAGEKKERKRNKKKAGLDEQVSYRDVFLQLLHVETGNVSTDV